MRSISCENVGEDHKVRKRDKKQDFFDNAAIFFNFLKPKPVLPGKRNDE
jgi:hypothetical protein